MMPFPAARMGRSHEVDVMVILDGQFDPRTYPFPYLAIIANGGIPGSVITSLLIAVGMLGPHGWDLVNITNTGNQVIQLTAFLRRRTPGDGTQ